MPTIRSYFLTPLAFAICVLFSAPQAHADGSDALHALLENWAYNDRDVNLPDHGLSNQVADYLVKIPPDLLETCKQIIALEVQKNGADAAGVNLALTHLTQAFSAPGGLEGLKQSDAFEAWAKNQLNISDSRTLKQVADYLLKVQPSQLKGSQDVLKIEVDKNGTDPKGVYQSLVELGQALGKPNGLDDIKVYYSQYAAIEKWAYNDSKVNLPDHQLSAQTAEYLMKIPSVLRDSAKEAFALEIQKNGSDQSGVNASLTAVGKAIGVTDGLDALKKSDAIEVWARDDLGVQNATARKQVADYLLKVQPAQLKSSQDVLKFEVSKNGVDPKGVNQSLIELTQALGKPTGLDDIKQYQAQYAAIEKWAYNDHDVNLPDHTLSAQAAEYLMKIPSVLRDSAKEAFALEIQKNGSDQSGVNASLTAVGKAIGATDGLDALKKNDAIEVWARDDLGVQDATARKQVADYLLKVSAAQLKSSQDVLKIEVTKNGVDPKGVNQSLIELTQALGKPTGLDDIKQYQAQYTAIEKWAYNDSKVNLPDRELSKQVAEYLMKLIPSQRAAAQQFFAAEIGEYGANQNGVNQSLTDLAHVYSKLGGLVSHEEYRKLVDSDGGLALIAPSKRALLAKLMDLPHEKALQAVTALKHIKSSGNAVQLASVVASFVSGAPSSPAGNSSYLDWVLSGSAPKTVIGCTQLDLLDDSKKQTVPLARCIDALSTYANKNDQGQCGLYTNEKIFIQLTLSQRCDNPLIQDLQSVVKTDTAPVHLYHYVTADRLGIAAGEKVNPSDPRVASHAAQWSDYFWNQDRYGKGENSGLYMATDPVQTREGYGKDRPVLYDIELPAGSKSLKIDALPDHFSDTSQAYVRNKGCDASSPEELFNRNANLSKACLGVLHDVVRQLGITDLTYKWQNPTDIPGCGDRSSDAHILVGVSQLKPSQIQIFTPDQYPTNPAAAAEAENIQQLFKETGSGGLALWPASSKEPSPSEFEHWKGAYIIGCEEFRSKADKLSLLDAGQGCQRSPSGIESFEDSAVAMRDLAYSAKRRD